MNDELSFDGFDSKPVEYVEETPVEEKLYCECCESNSDIITEAVLESLNSRKPITAHLSNIAYFTPEEFADLGIGNEDYMYSETPDTKKLVNGISIESWRDNYIRCCNGEICENYQKVWNDTLRVLYSDYNVLKESSDVQAFLNRKQSILNLCWNPEIPFNEANQIYAKNRVSSMCKPWELYDVRTSTYVKDDVVTESASTLTPMYFVVSKIPTEDHVDIRIDTVSARLENFVEWNGATATLDFFKGTTITVICAMVDKGSVEQYIEAYKDSYMGALWNKIVSDPKSLPNLTQVISAIKDCTRIKSNKFYLLYFGPSEQYNVDEASSMANMLLKAARSENASINEGAEFDDKGALIIYRSHSGKIDFGSEINASSKLCKIYSESGNMDGLKAEVAKLYFFYMWLDKEIMKPSNKDPNTRNEIVNCKRICTNVFSQNLKKIMAKEPDFVFGEYYNKTPYGGAIKITPDTFRYSIRAMLALLFGSKK